MISGAAHLCRHCMHCICGELVALREPVSVDVSLSLLGVSLDLISLFATAEGAAPPALSAVFGSDNSVLLLAVGGDIIVCGTILALLVSIFGDTPTLRIAVDDNTLTLLVTVDVGILALPVTMDGNALTLLVAVDDDTVTLLVAVDGDTLTLLVAVDDDTVTLLVAVDGDTLTLLVAVDDGTVTLLVAVDGDTLTLLVAVDGDTLTLLVSVDGDTMTLLVSVGGDAHTLIMYNKTIIIKPTIFIGRAVRPNTRDQTTIAPHPNPQPHTPHPHPQLEGDCGQSINQSIIYWHIAWYNLPREKKEKR